MLRQGVSQDDQSHDGCVWLTTDHEYGCEIRDIDGLDQVTLHTFPREILIVVLENTRFFHDSNYNLLYIFDDGLTISIKLRQVGDIQ